MNKEIIKADNETVLLGLIVKSIGELKDYNCPPKIIEMLEEWVFDLNLDRLKYIKNVVEFNLDKKYTDAEITLHFEQDPMDVPMRKECQCFHKKER